MKFLIISILILSSTINLFSQELPIENGELETVNGNEFTNWINQSIHGSNAVFDVVDNTELIGSTKALRTQVNALGEYQYSVQTKSNHKFSVDSGNSITISFFAKANSNLEPARIKLCLSDPSIGVTVFKQNTFELSDKWTQFTHTFFIDNDVPNYQISFRYLDFDSTYFIDQINAMPGIGISFDLNKQFQTIQGFGGGIKRRTEHLNDLPQHKIEIIENLIYKDLKINMLRFFIHHTIENNDNDNDDPFSINFSNTSWNYYNGEPFKVAETIQRAIMKSEVGIDHLIGNCNSAPGWMKVNNSHKRMSDDENVALNTLKQGLKDEFIEFIQIFLEGLNQNFGINVTDVSITNEPDFLNTYESMNLTPNELIEIIPELRTRLDNTSFSSVGIISPETTRVSPGQSNNLTALNSTVSYVESMFNDLSTKDAIDIIATHTYYDSSHDADWVSLETLADEKPIWVTESANLKSLDFSMDDASDYIKWITRGFNEGGMTAYMVHLLFDKHTYSTPEIGDKEGSSGLVVWDDEETIITPKRYFAFKHYSTLSGKGFKRVSHNSPDDDFYVTSFRSPDDNYIVLHVYNSSGITAPLTIETPYNTTSIFRYTTDNTIDFVQTAIDYVDSSRYFETSLTPKSLSSFIFETSTTLNKNLNKMSSISIYPNPTNGLIFFKGNYDEIHCSIYSLTGKKLFDYKVFNGKGLDLSKLSKGLYFIKTRILNNTQSFKVILN